MRVAITGGAGFIGANLVRAALADDEIDEVTVPDDLAESFGHRIDRTFAAPRAGEVYHSAADNARLRRLFPGVEPVDRLAGLRATVDWMKSVSGVAPAPAR